jgi:hypothetical protein
VGEAIAACVAAIASLLTAVAGLVKAMHERGQQQAPHVPPATPATPPTHGPSAGPKGPLQTWTGTVRLAGTEPLPARRTGRAWWEDHATEPSNAWPGRARHGAREQTPT